MPTQIKQENRSIAFKAEELDDNFLGLRRVSVQESLSRMFVIEADLCSQDGAIAFDKVIGHKATVRLNLGSKDKLRYFNGYVSRFVQVANQGGYACYHATIVPWMWFLTRTADCRIFQKDTVPGIIEEVFKGEKFKSKGKGKKPYGFNDYELKISSGDYPKWDYCVQYRETDFNYISRLMEQEGIYYFFEHKEDKHSLVLADSIRHHNPFEGYKEIAFEVLQAGSGAGREVITDWTVEQEAQPVAYALNDFDFVKSRTSLEASRALGGEHARKHGKAEFEMYDFPGEYEERAEGKRLAQVRLDELQTQYEVVRGQTTARGMAAGCVFTLKKHPRQDQNREYLITGVSLHADGGPFATAEGGGGGGSPFFSCSFTAIDSKQQFRPPRLTPKPSVQGPQTAIVVGQSDQEIYTDDEGHGCVKVKFHWDRYSEADENSSCWIRVSQPSAGKGWGAINIPRIGQEVIVEFVEGDPDHPIITGRVYNDAAKPPYKLPEHQTISTFKSNSSKGGQGFNEIRFEDKKGEEQVFIHGEKDLHIRIKNDTREFVANDRHLIVKNDQLEHVTNDRHEIVDANHKEKIGADRHLKVVGKEAKEVGDSLSLAVTGDVVEEFAANHSEQTTGDYYLKGDNVVIEGDTNVTIKVGENSIAIDSSGITLKVGENSIALESSGITIKGMEVKTEGQTTVGIKGQAGVTVESSAQVEVKSSMTTVKGDGMLTLKGGMVMIN